MKKLLLVLALIAMASFLFVGCLGEGTVADTDTDTDTDTVTETTMVIAPAYTDPLTGKTYVSGISGATGNLPDVTVTLPEAAEDGYVVYVGVKWYNEATGKDVYSNLVEATSTDDIVWTVEDYSFNEVETLAGTLVEGETSLIDDCTTVCVVALLKHPCCPGEEVAMEVVTVDKDYPSATLVVSFEDCATDVCDTTASAKMLFTSVLAGCEEETCCGDYCSGADEWSLTIAEALCAAACPVVSGTGCQITDTLPCGCLDYADGETVEEITYNAKFAFEDKVGNKVTEDWVIVVDSGSVVSFNDGTTFKTKYETEIGDPSIGDSYCGFVD